MSFFDRLFSWRKSAVTTTLDLFRQIYGGRSSATGKSVTVKTAVEVSAVVGCVRAIAEGMAQVPFKIMREADGKRLPAKDHPLYDLLAVKPNDWQTAFEFWEMLGWHLALCGNFFAFKNVVFGKIVELIPFEPGTVTVTREDDYTLTYLVTLQNGAQQEFPAESIWHVKGASWNSWMGLEAVALAREAIGLAMATEEQHARMHKNGVQTSGVYSVEGSLNEKQYSDLRKWIEKEMAGSENSGKPMIMDRAAKWLQTSMNGVDSQHLETRKFQIEEVCRFFRVMPIMVGYSDKAATYASAEQMFLAHLVHCLAPWYRRLEQSVDANLLTKKDRKDGHYACFVDAGILRGSLEVTKDFLLGLVNGGLMTPNEGRSKLDLNPDEDPASDKLRIPANITGSVPDADKEKVAA